MANHPQAEKRNRQRLKLQAHHRHYRTSMRTHVKRLRLALGSGDRQEAQAALGAVVPLIDRCAQKGIIPRQRASRLVSRLTCAFNRLTVAS
ncbi:MAG: 30S ribosomal protein S20 [Proteobacteria bacterium]|nr:30S ribosomal protein S20 [Pseudomonadota bacterium]